MTTLKLIREAAVLSTLTPEQKKRFTELSNVLGVPLAEVAQEFSNTVQPEDYQEWLRAIREIGEEEGLNLNSRSVFYDTAFDVLDGDPKMDMLGNNEKTKSAIVNTLYHAYKTAVEHEKVQGLRSSEENEEFGVDYEDYVNGEVHAMKSEPNPMIDLTSLIHSSPELQQVYRSGVQAGQQDTGRPREVVSKSPYMHGTKRDRVWKLGHKHGCVGV